MLPIVTLVMDLSRQAKKYLKTMPPVHRDKMIEKLERIEAGDTKGLDIEPVKGKDGYFRLKHSSFRAIYTKKGEVIVIEVNSRGEIYKRL